MNPLPRILAISDHPVVGPMAASVHAHYNIPATWRCTPLATESVRQNPVISGNEVNVKRDAAKIAKEYDLVFSYHCKQIFPPELVNNVRCINVHPGYNPFNRGWFPSQFSIFNGFPAGVTIHEMDEEIDAGRTIVREQVEVTDSDTSATVYEKIMALEKSLLMDWLPRLVSGDYATEVFPGGNYNSKADYESLRRIDLAQTLPASVLIARLRALSHPPYKNAYYIDSQGRRVSIGLSVEIDREESA